MLTGLISIFIIIKNTSRLWDVSSFFNVYFILSTVNTSTWVKRAKGLKIDKKMGVVKAKSLKIKGGKKHLSMIFE